VARFLYILPSLISAVAVLLSQVREPHFPEFCRLLEAPFPLSSFSYIFISAASFNLYADQELSSHPIQAGPAQRL
jgi:hypothetical protein